MNINTRIRPTVVDGDLTATYTWPQSSGDLGAWELRDKFGAVIDWEVGQPDRAIARQLIDRNKEPNNA